MAHISENVKPLLIRDFKAVSFEDLLSAMDGLNEVCIVRLPGLCNRDQGSGPLKGVGETVVKAAENLGEFATIVILGEIEDLAEVQRNITTALYYQLGIAIKHTKTKSLDNRHLPYQHFFALVYSRYKSSLRHTKTRIKYTFCPACDKTTKDYGGKKHTYHQFGTLISDVWRDISCDLDGDITLIKNRFADLFGLDPYRELRVIDCRSLFKNRESKITRIDSKENQLPHNLINRILCGDCLEMLKKIPSNSVDFAFADPPYNLGKKYLGYSDDLKIQDYFKWCDKWICEMARVLKPGRTLAVLNIPLWSIRHYLYMRTILEFQNWIVWDGLSFPVRMIMPSHYAILCFTKGKSRELPYLTGDSVEKKILGTSKAFNSLAPLADGYCLRATCINDRIAKKINDRATLTDLWADIHRLKHNSRRVDHPCQLPPQLMYRLITIFTKPGELVIDCFNGAGTTSLTAHQLGRNYVGIESSEKYSKMAEKRHLEIINGLDPFRKEERILTSKNSPVARLRKQVYKIPKKILQLEVKRIASIIGHIPSREEVVKYGKYSIEYYDKYFISWGEVTAAARTTGMTENRIAHQEVQKIKNGELFKLEAIN